MEKNNLNLSSPSFIIPAGKKEFQLFTKGSFVVITSDNDLEKEDLGLGENFSSKVRTIIFHKITVSLKDIIKNLLKSERSLKNEIFIIGFSKNKKYISIKSNLKDIQQVIEKQELLQIETIIVGESLCLIEKDKVFCKNILSGKKIIFTRTKYEPRQLLRDLRYLGAEILELPLFNIEMMGNYEAVDSIFACPQRYTWLVFTSMLGVEYFVARLLGNKYDISCLSKTKICALGLETAESLMSFGLNIDFIPKTYCLEVCLRELTAKGVAQENILILGNKEDQESLSARIPNLYEKIVEIPLYSINSIKMLTTDQLQQIEDFGSADLLIFNHPLSVKAIKEVWSKISHVVFEAKVAVVGPLTQKMAQGEGIRVDIMPKEVTIPSLGQAIIDYYCNQ